MNAIIHLLCPAEDAKILGATSHSVLGWASMRDVIVTAQIQIDGGPLIDGHTNVELPGVAGLDHAPHLGDPTGIEFVGVLDGITDGEHFLTVSVTCRSGQTASITRRFVKDSAHVSAIAPPDRDSQYARWLRTHRPPGHRRPRTWGRPSRPERPPRFSLIMPTYNSDPKFLAAAVRSVLDQSNPNWELCIVDDGSSTSGVAKLLGSRAVRDARISVQFLSHNRGIAGATQAGIDRAGGEFVGFLDHDDLLWPNALQVIADALIANPEADIVYTDEDKIDLYGRHFDPFFKPDWSPHLHLTCHFTCHFTVFRRLLIDQVGGMNLALSGSQDYDLMLRASEHARVIVHVPDILYSWRAHPGSAALNPDSKPNAHIAAHTALTAALARRGEMGSVVRGFSTWWRIRRTLNPEPLVSIIILTITERHINRCVRSLLALTTYQNYRVSIVENSGVPSVLAACEALAAQDARVKISRATSRPFNYSALNNDAARRFGGDYLCFLNDDTEIIDGDWLTALMEIAVASGVGVVGAQLLYPDRTVQHAGVVLGLRGVAGHAFKHFPPDHAGANGLRFMARDVSAVTFACAVAKREAFDRVGGLDAINVPLSYSDVDFCLRIHEAGYRVIYTPHATLIHHESATRGLKGHTHGERYMKDRWSHYLSRDPFYNIHLSKGTEDYSISSEARVVGQRAAVADEIDRLAIRLRIVLAEEGFGSVVRKAVKLVRRLVSRFVPRPRDDAPGMVP